VGNEENEYPVPDPQQNNDKWAQWCPEKKKSLTEEIMENITEKLMEKLEDMINQKVQVELRTWWILRWILPEL
jgi:hypothetical protein